MKKVTPPPWKKCLFAPIERKKSKGQYNGIEPNAEEEEGDDDGNERNDQQAVDAEEEAEDDDDNGNVDIEEE